MSISITHRVLANAFGSRGRTFASRATTAAQSTATALIGQIPQQGSVTCSPWEGLYMEPEMSVSQEVEAFLASLSHGK